MYQPLAEPGISAGVRPPPKGELRGGPQLRGRLSISRWGVDCILSQARAANGVRSFANPTHTRSVVESRPWVLAGGLAPVGRDPADYPISLRTISRRKHVCDSTGAVSGHTRLAAVGLSGLSSNKACIDRRCLITLRTRRVFLRLPGARSRSPHTLLLLIRVSVWTATALR